MNKWNEEDEKFLIDNNSTMNHIEIAKKLGKTDNAVRQKAIRLNIITERVLIPNESKWNKEEDKILMENKDKRIQELLKIFPNRTRQSIFYRKHVIGAKKYKIWDKKEIQIVRDNLHKTDREIAKMISHSESGIKSERRRRQALKRDPNKNWTEKDIKFLEKNQHLGHKELTKLLGMEKRRVYTKMVEMGLLKTRSSNKLQ